MIHRRAAIARAINVPLPAPISDYVPDLTERPYLPAITIIARLNRPQRHGTIENPDAHAKTKFSKIPLLAVFLVHLCQIYNSLRPICHPHTTVSVGVGVAVAVAAAALSLRSALIWIVACVDAAAAAVCGCRSHALN